MIIILCENRWTFCWRSDFKQSEWRDFSDRKYLLFYATDINYMYTWIPAGHGSLFSKFICMCHSHALAETTSETKLPKILQRKKTVFSYVLMWQMIDTGFPPVIMNFCQPFCWRNFRKSPSLTLIAPPRIR